MDLVWSKTIASDNYDWSGIMQKRGSFKLRDNLSKITYPVGGVIIICMGIYYDIKKKVWQRV